MWINDLQIALQVENFSDPQSQQRRHFLGGSAMLSPSPRVDNSLHPHVFPTRIIPGCAQSGHVEAMSMGDRALTSTPLLPLDLATGKSCEKRFLHTFPAGGRISPDRALHRCHTPAASASIVPALPPTAPRVEHMPGSHIRRTKIVATLGPAWDKVDRMHALLDAGVDLVRINASHGTPESRDRLDHAAQRGQAIAARADRRSWSTCTGPRIRVGKLPAPLTLTPGETGKTSPRRSWRTRAKSRPPTPSWLATWFPARGSCSTTACCRST